MPVFDFRKSNYSDEKAECVEIATNVPTTVVIRDSKNPESPSIRIAPEAWSTFQVALLQGKLEDK